MDAQNAAESAATKPPASTPTSPRPGNASEPNLANKAASDTPTVNKSTSAQASASTPPLPTLSSTEESKQSKQAKEPKESKKSKEADKSKETDNFKESSKSKEFKELKDSSVSKARVNAALPQQDDEPCAENNSEAETIVLPGKDGSPVKSRKVIKREDASDVEERSNIVDVSPAKRKPPDGKTDVNGPKHGNSGATTLATDDAKRKRLLDHPRSKDSSGLSSAPASPLQRSRQQSIDLRPESEGDSVHARSTKVLPRDREPRDREILRAKASDRAVTHKRKVPRAESDDEADNESHKNRRRRTSASIDASSTPRPQQKDRDHQKSKSNHESISSLRQRSTSPHPRTHRRSTSTQFVSQSSSGLSQKKRRVPPPLTTDYHSDESSASGSPHIRSSTMRGLTTPATAESNMSSAKNPAHKKHVDAHGQTQLAKACSRGEYDNVKRRLLERPQDLDFPDYAGNTPLQIAAINGYDDIVKLLVESGCDIDCVNHDKDTPLLDAVDNGHLEVIKVLLEAGVNPRKANVNGEEPLDRVDDELENCEEIRAALMEARKRQGDRRRTSEEQQDQQDNRSHGPDSPRRSPALADSAAGTRRAASSRSHKLSNHLLYMHMDDKTLRAAAGRGDLETVERILQVRDNFDDAESMVAAARGGHETVMNLLLALGNANPDPSPVDSERPEIATPILAAIGQENIRVIRLLLAQSNFDPTRKFRGLTYYEIAQKRQGPNWKEEEQILKDAYDAYKRSHRDPQKKSPNRRELDNKRSGRAESKDDSSRSLKRKAISPTREGHRVAAGKIRSAEKDSRGTSSVGSKNDELTSPKRGPGRPRKDDRGLPTIAISDGENSPASKSSSKQKRSDMDTASFSSEGESKPRKRLMSGRDLKEQREKNRRHSMVSNASSLREPSSPHEARADDPHELPTEKYHDRAKALKRDESRDRLSVSGDHSSKRSRTSATPDHVSEKEGESVKRRRLDAEKKERVPKQSSSPDRSRKSTAPRDGSTSSKPDDKSTRKHSDQGDKKDSSKSRKLDPASDSNRREPGKCVPSEKSIHVKAEDLDVVMRDADQARDEENKTRAAREQEEETKRRAELEAKKKEKEADERKRREDDELKRRQAEIKQREEAEKEKKRLDEEERKRCEEEARKKREEAERLQREEDDRRRKAEEERRRLEKEKEEERKKLEDQERIRKEEEAAEQARRRREEEERREQERREQERREQERRERQRALREAELRKREEQEKARLEKLPAFLRWLDLGVNIRSPETAKRFRILTGVRFDSIRPETAGTDEGRELWILNTEAALLLGEKDLQLTRYSGWGHVPASEAAKYVILGKRRPSCGLIDVDEWDLGRQLPGYYFGKEPEQLNFKEKRQLQEESKLKFLDMNLFFVKLSDLMFSVPNMPHLRNVEIVVMYEEIPETVEQYENGEYPSRWKDDPDADRYVGFSPRPKYYVNGQLVREGKVDINTVSRTPWPEQRVPRDGLTAVSPTNPNYVRLAKEQGLSHLFSGLRTPPNTVVARASPNRLFSQRAFQGTNDDLSPPQSDSTTFVNGDGHQPPSSTGSAGEPEKPLVNGTSESIQANGESISH